MCGPFYPHCVDYYTALLITKWCLQFFVLLSVRFEPHVQNGARKTLNFSENSPARYSYGLCSLFVLKVPLNTKQTNKPRTLVMYLHF